MVPKTKTNFPAKRQIPLLLQWTFLLFVFLMPLETLELGPATRGTLSLPRIVGAAMVGLSLVFWRHAFKALPRAGYFFLGYIAVFFASSLLVSEKFMQPAISLSFTFLQLFLLFWIATSLFCRNEEFIKKSCMAFGLGCFVLALCGLFNIGGMTVISTERGMERFAIEGMNPNYLAYLLALSVTILVGLYLNNSLKKNWHKILLIILIVPQVTMIVSSGSRGGLIALMLALFLYLTPVGLTKKKLLMIMVGGIAICAIGYVAFLDPVTSERLGKTMEKNHQESRNDIYSEAFLMIQERPVFGWGPKENEVKLGRRLGMYAMNPHNLYLQALLQTGMVGGCFLFMAIGGCLYSAWSSRKAWLGFIPVAVMIIVLIVNLAHEFLPRKATWFALALASTTVVYPVKSRLQPFRHVGRTLIV